MAVRDLNIAKTFIRTHVDAAARELEGLPVEAARELLEALPATQAHRILMHMLPPYAARLCAQLPIKLAASLLAGGDANHVVAILRCMPSAKRKTLLKVMPDKIAALCLLLLSYSKDTVGAWMTADIVMLPRSITVASALRRLADSHGLSDSDSIPLVDGDTHLVGLVSVRTLLNAKDDSCIDQLIDETRPALSSRASLRSVLDHAGWQRYDTLVVLNRYKQLIGILRHVDLRRGLEQPTADIHPDPVADVVSDSAQVYVSVLAGILNLFSGSPTSSRSTIIGKQK
ncbi:magnesium transporter MgtE N-terminal domain-containing protein [Alkalimarinus coralli]|uniref:magnesium transporter MgtE N-terminal domain-containing protein n=1 Tax=Alkalimarinus coralli TaxID=2935863 RepID=UPI00202B3776|nr:CBS domain-containing protein [Alkalimarinus coralli]